MLGNLIPAEVDRDRAVPGDPKVLRLFPCAHHTFRVAACVGPGDWALPPPELGNAPLASPHPALGLAVEGLL